jgi:UDP-N-acetylglucosamine--N-acetylmuramyl-(pentapeptide) pyrophosphoryl-undecaprenol N-acetylglucosamine transferase
VFIPFPFAANNHQEFNARYVAEAGGAEVILEKNLDGRLLARKIEEYASNPDKLHQMSLNASSLGRPDAARRIVEECRRLINE